MLKRNDLISRGMFPETLPPCFDGSGFVAGFHGIIGNLKERELRKNRSTSYIRYSGTKHDGNRRSYATPNPIPYFSLCQFLERNSNHIFNRLKRSNFSISAPKIGEPHEDRSVIVSSLNELSSKLSMKIKYAPFILKTDVSQFFPSIYTHAISWVAHGRDAAKLDRRPNSTALRFNRLDWFCQQCQDGQTRGVTIGADGFRLIAEYIACEIDMQLEARAGNLIIGGVRHVDDYYLGVKSEIDATVVLSMLREILQGFELQINDSKTKVLSGLEPPDDLWAQNLRSVELLILNVQNSSKLLDEAYEISRKIGSQSPLRLALRRLDQAKCYRNDAVWTDLEPRMQRIMFHFPHCIDYVCLLVVKRFALDRKLDKNTWGDASSMLAQMHVNANHHHEVCWLLWMLLSCQIPITEKLVSAICNLKNSHLNAMIIVAFSSQIIARRPEITFPTKLSSTDENWLHNLAARSNGFTQASFGGTLNDEFEHLASKKVQLIDFQKHLRSVAALGKEAISRSKYGYDSEDDDINAEIDWADIEDFE